MEYLSKWYRPFMVAATTLILVASVFGFRKQQIEINALKSESYFQQVENREILNKLDTVTIKLQKLQETHPYMGKWKSRRTGLCTTGNFLGFLLYTPVDTTVSKELIAVMSTYKGPTAKVNSLRRHYNKTSEHYHGKAVDLAWLYFLSKFLCF